MDRHFRREEITNDPSKAGKYASAVTFYGLDDRFAVYAIHTRSDAIEWFVLDTIDDKVIYQVPTRELAIAKVRERIDAPSVLLDAARRIKANCATLFAYTNDPKLVEKSIEVAQEALDALKGK